MASTTAEVLLYFGTDDPEFTETVNKIRFSVDPPYETRAIIDIINPIWRVAFDLGREEGYEDASY
jgi:hypothetical protein